MPWLETDAPLTSLNEVQNAKARAARQRALADKLRANMDFSPGAGMQGNLYVAGAGPLPALAQQLAGAYLGSKADEAEQAATQKGGELRQAILKAIPQETAPTINQPSQAQIDTGVPQLTTTPGLSGRGLEQARGQYALEKMVGSGDPTLETLGSQYVAPSIARAGKDIELADTRADVEKATTTRREELSTAYDRQVARDQAGYENMSEQQKRQFDHDFSMLAARQKFEAGQKAADRAEKRTQLSQTLGALSGSKPVSEDEFGNQVFQTKTGQLFTYGQGGQPQLYAGALKGKMSEGEQKTASALGNLQKSTTNYKDLLSGFTGKNVASPAYRARLESAQTDLLMQMKDAYTLGALAGPDYELMLKSVGEPTSLSGTIGAAAGVGTAPEKLKEIERLTKNRIETLRTQTGRELPGLGGGGAGNRQVIKSSADWEAIPAGTPWKTPDGRQGVK